MKRRDFIKQTACGTAAIAVGSCLGPFWGKTGRAHAAQHEINLGMTVADVEMVDTNTVPHWVYTLDGQPTLPGPLIFAHANETFTINVTNDIDDGRQRGFAVVGNDFAGNQFALLKESGNIPFGGQGSVTINAGDLRPGTYLYKDPTLGHISRVLGLHGVLVILPNPAFSVFNPYSPFATGNVNRLFNDLGRGTPRDPDAIFPGEPWFATTEANPFYGTDEETHSDEHHRMMFRSGEHGIDSEVFEKFLYRSRIWVLSSIDPVINQQIIDNNEMPEDFRAEFNPQYFAINGRQGAFGSHGPDVMMSSHVGEPHVVRMVNVGLSVSSPHPHGNHHYILSVNNVVGGAAHASSEDDGMGQALSTDNVLLVDTSTVGPEERVDILYPFVRPQDIPRIVGGEGLLLPLNVLLEQELALELNLPDPDGLLMVSRNVLEYPMHSHMELDQTAAGGNYPQGQVAHIVFMGDYERDESFRPDRRGSIAPQLLPLLLDD